ncbi:MAG: hypothetical protein IJC20_02625, partial [Clostridia bacterium]|nr:hypothetical protein [Clostridia bacterium]
MKRTLSIVLALLMLMSLTIFAFAAQTTKLGDINDDDVIDQVDYLLVKRSCFNTYELDSQQTVRADVNFDDVIDQLDYLLIKRHCFGTYTIPEISEPETSEPEISEPETSEPEISEPEVSDPDVSEPDVSEPDVSEPDVSDPDVSEPDVSEPDVSEPEIVTPDWIKPNEVTTVMNLTQGNSYTTNLTPYGTYLDDSGKDLTNGVVITNEDNQTTSPYADSRWVGFAVGKGQLEVVVPLGDGESLCELQRVEVNIGCDKLTAGVTEPNFDVYYTEDGTSYEKFGSYSRTGVDKYAVTAVVNPGASVKATAVKVVAKPALSGKTLVWLGEIAAYGIAPTELTQVSAHETENYLSDSTFSMFLNNAVHFALIPGLAQDIVPQGLARNPETGYVYISAYYNSGDKPSVIIVLDPNGKFVAEYFVYRSNGNAYTGHMGGICVTEDYLYFTGPTDSKGNYTVAEFELAHLPLTGSHKI